MTLATVVHQEVEQRTRAGIIGGVEDLSLPARGPDQAGALQLLEMERERRRGHRQPLRDLPGRHPSGPLLHEQAENDQSGFLRQCGQAGQGLLLFHNSIMMKMTDVGKRFGKGGNQP